MNGNQLVSHLFQQGIQPPCDLASIKHLVYNSRGSHGMHKGYLAQMYKFSIQLLLHAWPTYDLQPQQKKEPHTYNHIRSVAFLSAMLFNVSICTDSASVDNHNWQ